MPNVTSSAFSDKGTVSATVQLGSHQVPHPSEVITCRAGNGGSIKVGHDEPETIRPLWLWPEPVPTTHWTAHRRGHIVRLTGNLLPLPAYCFAAFSPLGMAACCFDVAPCLRMSVVRQQHSAHHMSGGLGSDEIRTYGSCFPLILSAILASFLRSGDARRLQRGLAAANPSLHEVQHAFRYLGRTFHD